MHKPLVISLLLAVTSAQIHADDAAYIQQQVQLTLAGAAQNRNRIDQSEIADLVSNSNANAKKFHNEAVGINNNAQNYLNSSQARKDQQWAIHTEKNIQSKPEYKQYVKYSIEACRIAERKSGTNLGCEN